MGQLTNTFDRKPCFLSEFVAEAHTFFLVVANRVDQFTLRGGEQPHLQVGCPKSENTFFASTAPSSPER